MLIDDVRGTVSVIDLDAVCESIPSSPGRYRGFDASCGSGVEKPRLPAFGIGFPTTMCDVREDVLCASRYNTPVIPVESGGRVGVIAVTVLLVTAMFIPTVALGAATSTQGATTDEAASRAVRPGALVVEHNNTTVRHENPETVDESGELDQVQRWLSTRLGNRLTESTIRLSRGEYELARRYVGDDYRRRLGQYADVAGETDTEADDEATERFRRIGEQHRDYVDAAQEYERTYDRYRRARQNGNERRARMLGHRMERLSRRVNDTGAEIIDQYDTLDQATGTDFSRSRRIIANTTRNVTDRQVAVRDELFVETRLVVGADAERTSFLEPLAVTGRLVAANGTVVRNRSIRLRVEGRPIRTRTNDTGRLSITYRPTLVGLDARTITLQYVPENDSVYLSSNATVPVAVHQVEPTITASRRPASVGFGETIVVAGAVSVSNIAVAGIPVVVTVGDRRVGRAVTDATGTYRVRTRIDSELPAGERTVRAVLPFENRALAGAETTTTIEVVSTPTRLSVNATPDGGTVRISGQLRTTTDAALADRPIELRIDSESVETVRTGSDGRYATTVAIPPGTAERTVDTPVTIVAAYEAAGTNLRPSRVETTIALSPTQGGRQSTGPAGRFSVVAEWALSSWRLVFVVIVGMVVGGFVVARLRESRDQGVLVGLIDGGRAVRPFGRDESRTGSDRDGPAVSDDGDAEPSTRSADRRDPLAEAHERLTDGHPDRAVTTAYALIRGRMSEELELFDPRTHWEFFAACSEDGIDDDRLDALQQLTEAYEQAAFAPQSVSSEGAEAALRTARALVAESY